MGRINVTSTIFVGPSGSQRTKVTACIVDQFPELGCAKLLRTVRVVDHFFDFNCSQLVAARKLTTSREILLWMTPSEAPKALQASECSELLDPMRASCWIFAQH